MKSEPLVWGGWLGGAGCVGVAGLLWVALGGAAGVGGCGRGERAWQQGERGHQTYLMEVRSAKSRDDWVKRIRMHTRRKEETYEQQVWWGWEGVAG